MVDKQNLVYTLLDTFSVASLQGSLPRNVRWSDVTSAYISMGVVTLEQPLLWHPSQSTIAAPTSATLSNPISAAPSSPTLPTTTSPKDSAMLAALNGAGMMPMSAIESRVPQINQHSTITSLQHLDAAVRLAFGLMTIGCFRCSTQCPTISN